MPRIMDIRLPLLLACTFATWLAAASPIHAQSPAPSTAETQKGFYKPDEVQAGYLKIADKDRKRMLAALPELILVPATFRWRDTTIENVAVRFKGNSSSSPMQRHKRSYLVKFDQDDKDRRFLDMRLVSFDNGIQFGSLFSEPIITEILCDHGIKTHRCNYAKVYVNEEYQGVYANVERIDESFIEHHLANAKGPLFKVDLGGPGANLQFLDDKPASYQRAFETKNAAAKKELPRLVEFIKWINQSEPSDFAKDLGTKLELDDFLRVTAIMLFSGAFDQLTGWGPHNYYLFHDTKADRWRYLPWDLDVGFSETAFGKINVLADWNAAWPVPTTGAPNPLLERIIADPKLLQRYREVARTILDKSFEPERLCAIIDAKYKLIRKDLETDPFPPRRATVPTDRSYDDIVASQKEFVRKRYASALQQLKEPGTRPKHVGPQDGPPPGLASKIQKIMEGARQMQQKGKDVSSIAKLKQRVGPLLQDGKFAEAEKLVDEALKLVE